MSTGNKAVLVDSIKETPLCQHLVVRFDQREHSKSYTVPGQFALISVAGSNGTMFAMSNRPGEDDWSFLIKKGFRHTDRLTLLRPGDRIFVTSAQGPGYDLDRVKGRHILLFAVGSGIAPIRASLLTLLANRYIYGTINLYYGALNPHEFAYRRDFPSWRKQGVNIIQTVFPDDKNWEGLKGFVQEHIPATVRAEKSAALVCGMQEMIEGVRGKLIALGFESGHILLNA